MRLMNLGHSGSSASLSASSARPSAGSSSFFLDFRDDDRDGSFAFAAGGLVEMASRMSALMSMSELAHRAWSADESRSTRVSRNCGYSCMAGLRARRPN